MSLEAVKTSWRLLRWLLDSYVNGGVCAYLFGIPGVVGRFVDGTVDNGCHQQDADQYGTDETPRDLPIRARHVARHLENVLRKPVYIKQATGTSVWINRSLIVLYQAVPVYGYAIFNGISNGRIDGHLFRSLGTF